MKIGLRRFSVTNTIAAGLFACLASLSLGSARAQSAPVGIASTAAGGGTLCAASILTNAPTAAARKSVGDGCPATQATLSAPVAMAIDRFDNILVSDQSNFLLRLIYNGGTAMANALTAADIQAPGLVPTKGDIYTIAGGPQAAAASASVYYCNQAGNGTVALNSALDGCPGAQAYLQARGMAFDADGNIFVTHQGATYTVRVLYVGGTAAANLIKLENPNLTGDPQPGYMYLIAGATGTAALAGDGGLAYKASIYYARGLYVDAKENVIFADAQNGLIRRVDGTTGIISTIAGSTARCPVAGGIGKCTVGASAGDGAPAADASVVLNYPYNIAFDGNNNMFISDSGQGTVTNGRVRVVYAGGTLAGITNPVVGNIYTYAGGGATTGTGAQKAVFQYVYGVGIDPRGYLYINDQRNTTSPGGNHVWRVDPTTGDIVNIAGSGAAAAPTSGAFCNGVSGLKTTDVRGDGCPGPEAYMNIPQQSPVFDHLGNFYIADRGNNVVRYFNYNNTFPSATTQTLSFTHPATSIPTTTTFTTQSNTSTSEFTDAGGGSCALAASTPAANVCTVNVKFSPAAPGLRLGSAIVNSATGPLTTEAITGISSAQQLTIDPALVTNLGSGIKPAGVSADELGNVYLSDAASKSVLRTTIAGGAATALITGLNKPGPTATDTFGNLYVADTGANTLVKRTPAGVTSTALTGLNAPQGLAADTLGSLYVADTGNNRIVLYSALSGQTTAVSVYPYVLNAPTALAVDPSGNLYILDSGNKRILELPTLNTPQLITLPTGVVPTTLAVDAAGSLYTTDSTSASLIQIAPSGASTVLRASLSAPIAIATDSSSNVFLADSSLTSVVALNRSTSSVTLASTNINDTSLPVTFTLSNAGNAPLTLATPPYTETGSSAAFPGVTPATCTPGLALASTATCTQSFAFKPTVTGAQSARATFTTDAGSSVSASLSAIAVNLIRTSLTLAQSPTGNTNYGQVVTYTVTLTPLATSTPGPTGTITLNVDGVQNATQAVSSNPYNFTVNLPVGTHSIAAAYNGDANYSSSNASAFLTVNKSVTTTAFSYQQTSSGIVLSAVVKPTTTGVLPDTGTVAFSVDGTVVSTVPVGNGSVSTSIVLQDGSHVFIATYSGDTSYAASTSAAQTFILTRTATTASLSINISPAGTGLTLTAKITPASGTGLPSGTVIFTNGTRALGTVTVANGLATLTTTSTAYSSTLFSASYSGDGLFQPSVANDNGFYAVPPPTPVGVTTGAQAVTTITVIPINAYSGTVTPTCSNLPANFICRFLPPTISLTAGASSPMQLELFAGVNPATASISPTPSVRGIAFALLLFIPAGILGVRRRNLIPGLLLIALLVLLPVGLIGCGAQLKTPAATNNTFTTPAGNYAITLTLTDTKGLARSTTVNVTVTQ